MAFLTAHWGNLLLLNYAAPREALLPFLPEGCELDLFEGSPYVSLVAFQFTRTRVLGVRWPLFSSFPEVNLRFYVRHKGKRGVCFVREFVPSSIVAGIARLLYNEPYLRAEMSDHVETQGGALHAHYHLRYGRSSLYLRASVDAQAHTVEETSPEHFFKEHELGVGRSRGGATLTYRVEHPTWRVHRLRALDVKIDAGLYGPGFSFLAARQPDSCVFAEGSEIVVYGLD